MSGYDLRFMSCLSSVSLMASLDILCSDPFNLKKKIAKTQHKKENILWPIKNFEKYFMGPAKSLPPSPTYLMYGTLVLKVRCSTISFLLSFC